MKQVAMRLPYVGRSVARIVLRYAGAMRADGGSLPTIRADARRPRGNGRLVSMEAAMRKHRDFEDLPCFRGHA
jgi:hypothetical protein